MYLESRVLSLFGMGFIVFILIFVIFTALFIFLLVYILKNRKPREFYRFQKDRNDTVNYQSPCSINYQVSPNNNPLYTSPPPPRYQEGDQADQYCYVKSPEPMICTIPCTIGFDKRKYIRTWGIIIAAISAIIIISFLLGRLSGRKSSFSFFSIIGIMFVAGIAALGWCWYSCVNIQILEDRLIYSGRDSRYMALYKDITSIIYYASHLKHSVTFYFVIYGNFPPSGRLFINLRFFKEEDLRMVLKVLISKNPNIAVDGVVAKVIQGIPYSSIGNGQKI